MPLDTASVTPLPPTTTMTVEQAMASAQSKGLQDVLVVGYDPEGELVILSSRMQRKDALWLCEMLREHILQLEGCGLDR